MNVNSDLKNACLEVKDSSVIAGPKARVIYGSNGDVLRYHNGSAWRNSSDLEVRTSAQLAADAKYEGATRYDSNLKRIAVSDGASWFYNSANLTQLGTLDVGSTVNAASDISKSITLACSGRPVVMLPSGNNDILKDGPLYNIYAVAGGNATFYCRTSLEVYIDAVRQVQIVSKASAYFNDTFSSLSNGMSYLLPTLNINPAAGSRAVQIKFRLLGISFSGVDRSDSDFEHSVEGFYNFFEL